MHGLGFSISMRLDVFYLFISKQVRENNPDAEIRV